VDSKAFPTGGDQLIARLADDGTWVWEWAGFLWQWHPAGPGRLTFRLGELPREAPFFPQKLAAAVVYSLGFVAGFKYLMTIGRSGNGQG